MAERKEALRMDAQTTEIAIKAFIRESLRGSTKQAE
jgi:hypothetical protein